MNDRKKRVTNWNRLFPIDYWWRQKHNIPFMSSQHKEVTFWDQLFEFDEERLYNEVRDYNRQEYVINDNDFLYVQDEIEKTDLLGNVDAALKELRRFKKFDNGDR